MTSTSQNITSGSKITVNSVDLKLVKQSAPTIEVGTVSNPLIFSGVLAGETTGHPDNPFLLYNDRTGVLKSTDAKNINIEVLQMNVKSEQVGISNGTSNQSFTVSFIPVLQETPSTVIVVINGIQWTEVGNFTGALPTDKIFTVNYITGTIAFGDGVNGDIPTNLAPIFVTYTPATNRFGIEARDDGWFAVQSFDVISNDRVMSLVPSVATSLTQVQIGNTPLKVSSGISGIWLISDTGRAGTNYFTGGTYNSTTGLVTLGTALPLNTTRVLADYTYTILNDAEVSFSQLSKFTSHTFANPIPSNNAKKLNFYLVVPNGVSPTNGINVQIRLRLSYTEN